MNIKIFSRSTICLALSIFNFLTILTLIVIAIKLFWDFKTNVFWFEKVWLNQATQIQIEGDAPLVKNSDINKFLYDYSINNNLYVSLRSPLTTKKGTIVIDGETYPMTLTNDKFTGDVIAVKTRWKYIELFKHRD